MSNYIRVLVLIATSILVGSCTLISETTPEAEPALPTPQPQSTSTLETIAPTETITPTSLPSSTSTSTATLTASPTPLYILDLSGYDPDIFQPIDVSHNPPLIARADETIELVFDFASSICIRLPVSCIPEGVLFYAYGDDEAYETMALTYEIVEEMDSLVARLPVADQDRGALHYYAQFSVPEAGYTQRYPVGGSIEVFAASDFISVELPTQNAVSPGERVYDFFWGYAPGEVRQATYEGYPRRVGPPALDVSDEGKIALLDPANERVLTLDPGKDSYASFPLPFTYKFHADLAYDPNEQLMICDFQGEEVEGSFASVPYCFRLLPDGELDGSTPVYVKFPSKITRDHQVLDYYDSRLVVPFDSTGAANSREDQRQKEAWVYPKHYVKGQDPYVARYADVKEGVAFEVNSASPLGVLTEFDRTPQGYVMSFSLGDSIRAVWIDSAGAVLKDVTVQAGQYAEINFNGQVAIGQDGALYVLGSTEWGIEVHYVGAP